MTKLTSNEAIEIRRAIEQGVTNRELAKLYGVSDTTISQIKGGTRHQKAACISKQAGVRVVRKMVHLTIEEAEAILSHLDACLYWMTNRSLERENGDLALMLQQRIEQAEAQND